MLRQLQKCQLFGALLSILIQVDGFQLPFRITNSEKTNITVHDGENVEFTCIASDHFQFCAFERANSGTICRRKWRKVTDCDAFKNRAEFTEGPNPNVYKKKCKLQLKSVTLEDEGKWTCVLDTFNERYQAKKDIFLTVIKTKSSETTSSTSSTTITSTSSTTTTSTTTTTGGVLPACPAPGLGVACSSCVCPSSLRCSADPADGRAYCMLASAVPQGGYCDVSRGSKL